MLAVGFSEVRDGEPLRCDERGGELAHDSGLEIGAPMVAAREERVTGGGTDTRGGMSARETHSARSKAVDVQGGNVFAAVAADVGVTHVIAEDEPDVRFLVRMEPR